MLVDALRACQKKKKKKITDNSIGDAGMTDFSCAIASGSLPSLEHAFMSDNPGNDSPVQEALEEHQKLWCDVWRRRTQ
jgi:hypothetical protein